MTFKCLKNAFETNKHFWGFKSPRMLRPWYKYTNYIYIYIYIYINYKIKLINYNINYIIYIIYIIWYIMYMLIWTIILSPILFSPNSLICSFFFLSFYLSLFKTKKGMLIITVARTTFDFRSIIQIFSYKTLSASWWKEYK